MQINFSCFFPQFPSILDNLQHMVHFLPFPFVTCWDMFNKPDIIPLYLEPGVPLAYCISGVPWNQTFPPQF